MCRTRAFRFPYIAQTQPVKKKRKTDILKGIALFIVLVYAGVSIINFFVFPTPVYMDGGSGMVSQEDFEIAHERNVLHHGHWSTPHPSMLVEPDCPYVKELAEDLCADSEWRTLKNILRWISLNIDYESDDVLYGTGEYWALPCETLYYMKGDCEDYAILFCSLAVAGGMDVCILDYPTHVSAGVYQDGELYFCDLFDGYLLSNMKWKGDNPVIVSLETSWWNQTSVIFAWSNKWMHKGADFILP